MAAGVHLARCLRGIGLAGDLQNRQGIHVRPQAHHLAGAVRPPPDDADTPVFPTPVTTSSTPKALSRSTTSPAVR